MKQLRLLFVEDNPDDLALLLREIRRGGYEPSYERVETEEAMRLALVREPWDIVICDFTLPTFSAPAALDVLHRSGRDIPLIIASGTVGEDIAVESLRAGAQDFVVKDNLRRLVPAIERELADATDRRARRQAEEALGSRDAILSALGAVAEKLLRCGEWQEVIAEVLARLGDATDSDRVFVYRVDPGGPALTLTHEWVGSEGVPMKGDSSLERLSLDSATFGEWFASDTRVVHGPADSVLSSQRELVERYGIRSAALSPVRVDEAAWGLIGFSQVSREREWSPAETDALSTVAGAIGAAIQRSESRKRMERQVRRLGALRKIDVSIIRRLGLTSTLRTIAEEARLQLETDAVVVLVLSADGARVEREVEVGFHAQRDASRGSKLRERVLAAVRNDGEPVWVTDLERSDEPAAVVARNEGFRGYAAAPLMLDERVEGTLEVYRRVPIDPDDEWLDFLELLAGQAAIAIDHARLIKDLERSNAELGRAYDATLEAWAKLLDLRDRETEGHSRRVTEMTIALARELDVPEERIVHLQRGALLHDIGKMGIPDRILQKPGPLDEDEWEVMRLHPILAHEFLEKIPFLRTAIEIPHLHHEKWDGTGYPLGLEGEDIPLSARIFAVADVWDALSSKRPYRDALPRDEVIAHIRNDSGKHFDPRVVEAFDRIIERERTGVPT